MWLTWDALWHFVPFGAVVPVVYTVRLRVWMRPLGQPPSGLLVSPLSFLVGLARCRPFYDLFGETALSFVVLLFLSLSFFSFISFSRYGLFAVGLLSFPFPQFLW